jgi:polysaccharide biosynthesis/export protein
MIGRRGLILFAFGLGGCASTLSESGPTRDTVVDGASIQVGNIGNQENVAYALVRVSSDVLGKLAPSDTPVVFTDDFITMPSTAQGAIGIGDLVSITVFENGAGGLFIPSEPGTRVGNFVALPVQQVDTSGNVQVPFAGLVHAAGLLPEALAKSIQTKLEARALEPQVIVTITDRRAKPVSVTGDVNTSTHFTLDPGGERLLGALARAGGSKYPSYESLVTIERGGQTERAFISDIMREPQQNFPLRAGDTIYVSRVQRYYLALGALGPGQYLGLVNRRLAFEDSHLSLADAIAKVGGLSDDRANARAVFVYRFETPQLLAKFGIAETGSLPRSVPTIYYLDLAEAAGYIYASEFGIRSEDLLYVSNAPATDITKFLNIVLPLSSAYYNFKASNIQN